MASIRKPQLLCHSPAINQGHSRAKLKLPEEKIIKVLESLENYPILPISEAMFWTALAIRRRYQISYWDGAIIAAAAELGCHTVYSEDLSHNQI